MAKWFYDDQNGKKTGPVSGAKIKLLVNAGVIAPETAVLTESGIASVAGKIQALSQKTPEDETQLHPDADVDNGRESVWSDLRFYARLLRNFGDFCAALSLFIVLVIFVTCLAAFPQGLVGTVTASGSILATAACYWLATRFLYNFACLKVSEEFETRTQTLLLKEMLILLQRQNNSEKNPD